MAVGRPYPPTIGNKQLMRFMNLEKLLILQKLELLAPDTTKDSSNNQNQLNNGRRAECHDDDYNLDGHKTAVNHQQRKFA